MVVSVACACCIFSSTATARGNLMTLSRGKGASMWTPAQRPSSVSRATPARAFLFRIRVWMSRSRDRASTAACGVAGNPSAAWRGMSGRAKGQGRCVTWKAHRDAVFYGDTRRYGLASSYVFGRIGTGFGKDKRKMCPGRGVLYRNGKRSPAGPRVCPAADDDDSSISPSGADKGMDCFGKTDAAVECRGREG